MDTIIKKRRDHEFEGERKWGHRVDFGVGREEREEENVVNKI